LKKWSALGQISKFYSANRVRISVGGNGLIPHKIGHTTNLPSDKIIAPGAKAA